VNEVVRTPTINGVMLDGESMVPALLSLDEVELALSEPPVEEELALPDPDDAMPLDWPPVTPTPAPPWDPSPCSPFNKPTPTPAPVLKS